MNSKGNKTVNKAIEELMITGNFLSFSINKKALISYPVLFELNDTNSKHSIKVKIYAAGIIEFTPQKRTSKDIVLSSGIHGNETAPIEICEQLIKGLFDSQISLKQRVLFIFGNLQAIKSNKRFVDENLNRLFGFTNKQNAKTLNKEQIRAKEIEHFVEVFYKNNLETVPLGRNRYHYDLHTAIRESKHEKFAIAPFLHGRSLSKHQLRFLNACGINTVLFSRSATTTFSYYTSKFFSAHAYTLELGKVKPFGENDIEEFADFIKNIELLLSFKEIVLKPFNNNDFNLVDVFKTVIRSHEQFNLCFDETLPNFSVLPINTTIAIDNKQAIKVTRQQEAIIFPNAKVAIGQRALLTVIPINLHVYATNIKN
jgi:succinylglutamate desuccinylase